MLAPYNFQFSACIDKEFVMKHSKLALAALFIFAVASIAAAQEAKDARADQVDKLFAAWDKPDSPGCALAIIKDGRIVYKRGYGMAHLEQNAPITSTTIFDTGSVSKQFTAMSMLLLAEQGKISLDDDIRKYLPEMPQYEATITIRHLINHTSGIRDYLTLIALSGGGRDEDFYLDGEVVDLLARQKQLNFKPGDQWLYSNSGYFLLSQIMKRASGKTLRQFADENIFKPLAMNNTHFNDDHTEIIKNRAQGYAPRRGGGFSISVSPLDMVGDGNVVTTVEDLFLWDQNFYHNKLGKGRQELIAEAERPGALSSGAKLDYAAGLRVASYKGLKEVSHGGAFVGYRAGLLRLPDQRFSVACECNLAIIDPMTLAHRVADLYLADQFKQETAKAAAETNKPGFIELSEAEMKDKLGAYRNPVSGVIWKLHAKDGKLMADVPGLTLQFAPASANEFHSVNGPVKRVLKFEKQGQSNRLAMRMTVEGQEPIAFEAVELASPTEAELASYVGDYYSEELAVVYKVVLEGGKLHIRHENKYKELPPNALEPTLKDAFFVQGVTVNFKRDDQKRIQAFTLDAGRVKNIRFVKKTGETRQAG
jgi:CubicO group peptidase (beta-lactamase class C family)